MSLIWMVTAKRSLLKNMNQEFGYSWQRPKIVIFVIPVLIGYIVWRYDQFKVSDGIIVSLITGWSLLMAFSAMCKVRLTDSEIEVNYIVPFRKGGIFSHTEIESYAEGTFERKDKSIPMLGMIKPKGKKQMMILPAGTENFTELNKLLQRKYPEPIKQSEPVAPHLQ
jgi:hypothetical protein